MPDKEYRIDTDSTSDFSTLTQGWEIQVKYTHAEQPVSDDILTKGKFFRLLKKVVKPLVESANKLG